MVIDETYAQAKDAAELVMVGYEPLGRPPHLRRRPRAAYLDGASNNLSFDWGDGDKAGVDAAFASADAAKPAGGQNRVSAMPMETCNAIGVYMHRDRYTIDVPRRRGGTCAAGLLRQLISPRTSWRDHQGCRAAVSA